MACVLLPSVADKCLCAAACAQGMVKYASALPRESIVDVEGKLAAPAAPVEGCSQSQVRPEWGAVHGQHVVLLALAWGGRQQHYRRRQRRQERR